MHALLSAIESIPVRTVGYATSDGLGDEIALLSRATAMLTARIAGRVADQKAAGPDPDGLSLTRWVAVQADMGNGEARSVVALANTMVRHPDTADRVAAGEVSRSKAVMLSRVAAAHPKLYERDEEMLLTFARDQDVADLNKSVRYWRNCADDEHAGQEATRQRDAAYVNTSVTYAGMVRLDGFLDPATGEALITALDAATPPPVSNDRRNPGNRRAEALGTICEQWLDTANHGRKIDGGVRPAVTLTIDLDTLQGRNGRHCELDHTGPVSGETARRILCDCELNRVITRGDSLILDVGRTTRVIPPALRRALNVRDKHCRFRGCKRPLRWLDTHHKTPWHLGGPTNLDNCILLCRRHHTMIHHGQAVIQGNQAVPVGLIDTKDPP